jgi:DegV family protein with EDD domain
MTYKIVSDSSSNIFTITGADYATVPMKVIAAREYIDTPDLDLQIMVDDLKAHKGKSGSSCPNVGEWLEAFGDADMIFGVTISKNLSGSYNAAQQAAQVYMEQNPGKRVYIFDSLSAGPEQAMLIDKISQLIQDGCDFDTIVGKARDYNNHTHILFCLESLTNLARNGRVNPTVAKIAGVLGIRVIGDAKGGEITPAHKIRGEKKSIQTLVEMLAERGFGDGKLIRVAHCFGESQANAFREAVMARFPGCRFVMEPTTALCSFYAEAGGLIIGLEGDYNSGNNSNDF